MIDLPYTLFIRVCIYRDESGSYFTDDLWQQDLAAHFTYISDFRLCCPVEPLEHAEGEMVRIEGLHDRNIIRLKRDGGWGSVARNLIPNFRSVARALRSTKIAHSDGAGWAFPLSYYLLILHLFYKFHWIIVIESSFWMKPKIGPVTPRQTLRHFMNLWLIRACLRRADARIFTQDWYRRVLTNTTKANLIAPAVWVTADQIITPAQIEPDTAQSKRPLRVLFPSRLIASKGVQTVMDTITLLAENGVAAKIDIMGSGPLEETCRDFCAGLSEKQSAFIDPVPYGAPFFDVVRSYDAVIVANMQDEQPRIVFDANSQGVPCIATQTEGLNDLVIEGETGYQFPIDDSGALSNILTRIASGDLPLQPLKAQALAFAKSHTHTQMHQTRAAFLKDVLDL